MAKVGTLSQGMKQMIQFVVAIIHRPTLLILDEPFSGLDPLNVKLTKEILGSPMLSLIAFYTCWLTSVILIERYWRPVLTKSFC